MDFTLTEDQESLRGLAADIFNGHAAAERLDQVEAGDDALDRQLWSELAKAGLLGVAVPEEHGGLGLGVVDLALVCEEQGRTVAPVPLVWSATAAMAIAEHGSADQQGLLTDVIGGEAIITSALPHGTSARTEGDALTGRVIGVPYAHVAAAVLVPVGDRLYVVRPEHVEVGRVSSREMYGTFSLDGARAEPLGAAGAAQWLWLRTLVALAAVQSGVTAGALRMAADYTSNRKQFDKPLSSFQGVSLRAADGYIDNAAIRSTTLQAAWHLDEGHADAELHALSAAWWAADGGQRCVHATQHIHGGIGADITYPIHRYFLWGKQLELLVSGASGVLARLGDVLASTPGAGDAVTLG